MNWKTVVVSGVGRDQIEKQQREPSVLDCKRGPAFLFVTDFKQYRVIGIDKRTAIAAEYMSKRSLFVNDPFFLIIVNFLSYF